MARLKWPFRGRVNWLAVGLSLIALLAASWSIYQQTTVRTQAKSLADQVSESCAQGGPVAQQLGKACAKAAEVNDQTATTPAAPAQADPTQLRQAARTAVAEYCAAPTRPCRGSDGSTPPFDAIVDAVVARIPAPKNGTDGQDGRDAPVPDYTALVASYCGQADEPCRGPAGQKGDNGETGPRGPAGPTCPDGYELRDAVITAPDGTTYSGKACVDPSSSAPPSTDPPLPLGG